MNLKIAPGRAATAMLVLSATSLSALANAASHLDNTCKSFEACVSAAASARNVESELARLEDALVLTKRPVGPGESAKRDHAISRVLQRMSEIEANSGNPGWAAALLYAKHEFESTLPGSANSRPTASSAPRQKATAKAQPPHRFFATYSQNGIWSKARLVGTGPDGWALKLRLRKLESVGDDGPMLEEGELKIPLKGLDQKSFVAADGLSGLDSWALVTEDEYSNLSGRCALQVDLTQPGVIQVLAKDSRRCYFGGARLKVDGTYLPVDGPAPDADLGG